MSHVERGTFTKGVYAAASEIGASHIAQGMPCQDACKTGEGRGWFPYTIVAVADGHGDQRHDLSDIGAATAVEVAVRELSNSWHHYKLYRKSFHDFFCYDAGRRIVRAWRQAITHCAETAGVTARPGRSVYERYGTTVQVAMWANGYVLMAKVGDGEMRFSSDGISLQNPFVAPSDLDSQTTHSLAMKDASRVWQTAVYPEPAPGGYVFVSTDGLSNSFPTDQDYNAYVQQLYNVVETHGLEAVSRSWPSWFSSYTHAGSGDDITAGMICFGLGEDERGKQHDSART
ncbi:serine/threonine protein phosphatase PrpC [Salsuginibacillus halophilus]|uniref:Serine/threonine protein phosphatase PrpC n=1 Tax=Salsuginibacillus halophilus TaxID=517424 RepID=A0A2P8HBI2_9BACI|nr:protein phosphatase 2C domain-containing protein [Salsuginibacillus halophilus]PSL43584.1 serine/threonine protein phosphatase PrpC [Salsuginibacillus halophilus]